LSLFETAGVAGVALVEGVDAKNLINLIGIAADNITLGNIANCPDSML
jgi:hypothetical protein